METKLASKKTGKFLIVNAIVGSIYFIVAGFVLTMIGDRIGVDSPQDFSVLGQLIATYNPLAIVYALVVLVVLGSLTFLFAWINAKIHQAIHDKQKHEIKIVKKYAIGAFLISGFIWAWMIAGISQFFSAFGAGTINILDGMTLIGAILQYRIDIFVVSLFALAIAGWLITQTVRVTSVVTEKLESTKIL